MTDIEAVRANIKNLLDSVLQLYKLAVVIDARLDAIKIALESGQNESQ